MNLVERHSDGRRAVVISSGDLWIIDPVHMSGELLLPAIDSRLAVDDPAGWVFTRQGLAFARLGPDGLVWHTKRLSLDGFDQVEVEGERLIGLASEGMGDGWLPFQVELSTGRSWGGSFGESDLEGWERLALGTRRNAV